MLNKKKVMFLIFLMSFLFLGNYFIFNFTETSATNFNKFSESMEKYESMDYSKEGESPVIKVEKNYGFNKEDLEYYVFDPEDGDITDTATVSWITEGNEVGIYDGVIAVVDSDGNVAANQFEFAIVDSIEAIDILDSGDPYIYAPKELRLSYDYSDNLMDVNTYNAYAFDAKDGDISTLLDLVSIYDEDGNKVDATKRLPSGAYTVGLGVVDFDDNIQVKVVSLIIESAPVYLENKYDKASEPNMISGTIEYANDNYFPTEVKLNAYREGSDKPELISKEESFLTIPTGSGILSYDIPLIESRNEFFTEVQMSIESVSSIGNSVQIIEDSDEFGMSYPDTTMGNIKLDRLDVSCNHGDTCGKEDTSGYLFVNIPSENDIHPEDVDFNDLTTDIRYCRFEDCGTDTRNIEFTDYKFDQAATNSAVNLPEDTYVFKSASQTLQGWGVGDDEARGWDNINNAFGQNSIYSHSTWDGEKESFLVPSIVNHGANDNEDFTTNIDYDKAKAKNLEVRPIRNETKVLNYGI